MTVLYDPAFYVHELDKRALDAMNAFPKFVKLKEAYIANVDEKAVKIELLSKTIRITDKQFSKIYELLPPICDKLGIAVPEIYYEKSRQMNAYTVGSVNPLICVTSRLVNELPPELVGTVLAHECGHIACKHYLYHAMASQLKDGIENSPLSLIPAIRRYVTPTLVSALHFWYRCSELSADRAAVLCDGDAEHTVDLLLKLNGYKNINREEFLRQAVDLNAYVNDSKSNKLMELILVQDETHPLLATRAYECYEWAKSERFSELMNGTCTFAQQKPEQEEVISAELSAGESGQPTDVDELNAELERVNADLERYVAKADQADYAFAVFSGLMAGAIDSIFVGEFDLEKADQWGNDKANAFVKKVAETQGYRGTTTAGAISKLESSFEVAQDNVWKGAAIGVAAKNHHLADLAHHPTPLGLVSAMMVQFLRIGTFVNRDGEWHFLPVKTSAKDMVEILAPAAITGILNWLAALAENKYESSRETEIPKSLHRLLHLAASTPMLVEVAKCADRWLGHLVSDMDGSKKTPGAGMGIPGVFISLLYELSALPILKNTDLPRFVDQLYERQKIDLRHEIPLYKAAGKQLIPVAFNEILVRLGYFLTHFLEEIVTQEKMDDIRWNRVIPFHNRTVDRMLTVSTMTFSFADTADAAIRAAVESGANWVLFSGRFVTRFNYVGAGRAAVAIVKEISAERKETQFIHEKMILSEKKAALFLGDLQTFKARLEEKVTNYLAEDISAFLAGFDEIGQGLAAGDSDLVIHGNIRIWKVLGREPQFTDQKEFDELMESELPLKL